MKEKWRHKKYLMLLQNFKLEKNKNKIIEELDNNPVLTIA